MTTLFHAFTPTRRAGSGGQHRSRLRTATHALVGLVLVTVLAACQPGDLFTVAGNGMDQPYGDGGPASAAVATVSALGATSSGDVLVGDTTSVRKVDHTTGIISTIIGSRVAGDSGDGGPAAKARLRFIRGIAVAPNGDIYVSDQGAHRIRRVDHTTGTITTVAGNGTAGFAGDGGPATAAQLNAPQQLALGSDGSLYVADRDNNRVRRITAAGTIDTYVGTGVQADTPPTGSRLAVPLWSPSGLAFDSAGTLYVSSRSSIVKVASNGQVTTTALPTTCCPTVNDLAVVADGTVYAQVGPLDRTPGSFGGNAVRLPASLATLTVIAADEFGSGSYIYNEQSSQPDLGLVAVAGKVIIGQSVRNTAVAYDTAGGTLSTFLGAAQTPVNTDVNPTDALGSPVGLVYDMAAAPDGGTYLASRVGGAKRLLSVRYIGTDKTLHNLPWLPHDPKTGGIRAVAVGSDGAIYVSDGSQIWRFASRTATGTLIAGAAGRPEGGDGGPASAAGVQVTSLAVDSANNVYLAGNRSIRRIDGATGLITHVAGGQGDPFVEGSPAASTSVNPADLAVTPQNDLLLLDRYLDRDEYSTTYISRIRKIDMTSGLITTFAGGGAPTATRGDGGPAVAAHLDAWSAADPGPSSKGYDYSGSLAVASDGTVYVSEPMIGIRRITPDGIINTIVRSTALPSTDVDPLGVPGFHLLGPIALRGSDLWIADRSSDRTPQRHFRIRAVLDPRHAPQR